MCVIHGLLGWIYALIEFGVYCALVSGVSEMLLCQGSKVRMCLVLVSEWVG